MKFVRRDMGEAADASSGGGGRGLLREITVLVTLVLGLSAALFWVVGGIVELVLPRISFAREQSWFRGVQLPIPLRVAVAGDSDELRRVEMVLHRLQENDQVPALDYRIVVLQDDKPNAFAFPGGTIGVTRGLLDLLNDDFSLAFVLGHEIGHTAQRDPLRAIGRRFGRALAWAIVFGNGGGDSVSEHVTTLLELRHSRAAELGADRFGLQLVQATYGTMEGTDRLFTWLEARQHIPTWGAMLTTHPDPGDRLVELRRYANELGASLAPRDSAAFGGSEFRGPEGERAESAQ